ncbi:hypothetical protein L6R52_28875 [Myxococcota bacterium]|nr:hypothetical protein [Myxococcota bacterium]
MKPTITLTALALAACGSVEPGVQSITFDLRPTATSNLAEVDPTGGATVVFELMSATARVSVDLVSDQGLVTTRDLPNYARNTYVVRIEAARDARTGLPTATPATTEGHVFPMTEDAPRSGRWRSTFDAIPGHELGAVRGATIFIVPIETASIADGGHHPIPGTAVLTGSAADVTTTNGTTPSTGAPHVHGI